MDVTNCSSNIDINLIVGIIGVTGTLTAVVFAVVCYYCSLKEKGINACINFYGNRNIEKFYKYKREEKYEEAYDLFIEKLNPLIIELIKTDAYLKNIYICMNLDLTCNISKKVKSDIIEEFYAKFSQYAECVIYNNEIYFGYSNLNDFGDFLHYWCYYFLFAFLVFIKCDKNKYLTKKILNRYNKYDKLKYRKTFISFNLSYKHFFQWIENNIKEYEFYKQKYGYEKEEVNKFFMKVLQILFEEKFKIELAFDKNNKPFLMINNYGHYVNMNCKIFNVFD